MNKKITLKAAAERAWNFPSEDLEKEIMDTHIEPSFQEIRKYEYVAHSIAMVHFFCPSCRHEWDKAGFSYQYHSPVCPNCGEEDDYSRHSYKYVMGRRKDEKDCRIIVLDVDIEAGYLLIGKLWPDYTYKSEAGNDVQACLDAGNFDFLHGRWILDERCSFVEKFLYVGDKGFRTLSENGGISPATKGRCRATYELKGFPLAGGKTEELMAFAARYCDKASGLTKDNVIDVLIRTSEEIIQKNIKDKPLSWEQRTAKLLAGYEPGKVSVDDIVQNGEDVYEVKASLLTKMGEKATLSVTCPACGKTFTPECRSDDVHGELIVECPVCGKEMMANLYHNGTSTTVEDYLWFEVMPNTDYLIQRKFRVTVKSLDGKTTSRTAKEINRVYYTEKKPIAFKFQESYWRRAINPNKEKYRSLFTGKRPAVYKAMKPRWVNVPVRETHYCSWGLLKTVQTRDEIRDLIKMSVLKYSGLTTAWGLESQPGINDIGNCDTDSYVSRWYQRPYVEKTLLAGLTAITLQLLRADAKTVKTVVNTKAESALDLISVNKPVWRIARELNLNLSSAKTCMALWEVDHTITAETYTQINEQADIGIVLDIAQNYGIPVSKIMEYLDSCYNNQCIEKPEALNIWHDYLYMANAINYLTDKGKIYPQSLKKEHDRAIFAYRVIDDERNVDRFERNARKNKWLEYSYKDRFVYVPQKPEEIVKEASRLRNCLASYVNRIRDDTTAIAFIRMKNDPDREYFAMEVKNGAIVQVHGYCNCNPKENALLEFLGKFAAAKNLKMRF